MRYTPRSRDRYKNLLALMTGVATFGSFAGTGIVTGVAAHDTALQDQERAQADALAAAAQRAAASRAAQPLPYSPTIVVTKARPQKTVVEEVSVPAAAAVGSGGTVSPTAPAAPPVAAAPAPPAGGTTVSQAPPAAPAPPPAPAPAPAPSSGS